MGYFRDVYNSTMAMADPQASEYPLMGAPHHMLTLVALYIILCLQGPKCMEGYKPWNLKKIIIVYNFAMSSLNLYICSTVGFGLLRKGYSVSCERLDTYRNIPDERQWLTVGWLFVVSKFIEFLDTVLFVLSNKTSHVTFLHCYHHATMACFTWLGYKFLPGGANIIYPLINGFIHVVMYIYYGMAAMGPKVKKYLWWKKYLTVMQMTQFLVFLLQAIINKINNCPIPTVFKYAVFFYTVSIFALFVNFYVKAYSSRRAHASTANGKKSHASTTNGKKVNSSTTNGKKSAALTTNGKKFD